MLCNKSWDPVWEEIFSNHEWGKYPSEELVRFMARNFPDVPERRKKYVLDAGCGAGSSLWYLAREGFSATGLDGSHTALARAKSRLIKESLNNFSTIRGDLVCMPFADSSFDCIIDISAVHQNRLDVMKAVYKQFARLLKPGGKIFAMMPSTNSWGYGTGEKIEENTFRNVCEGPYRNLGTTHFSTREELECLLSDFSAVSLETITRTFEGMKREIKIWVISAAQKS
ncbi:MAG: class I SAM-dependent methyltransferase [Candidatus Riflebacteria bacterium]|nr:class I SAM-dependent methyltransferase [Candidatus Riflebacteria bacterium]